MKTLLFYEVNKLGPISLRLPQTTDDAKVVFDAINNLGATTENRLIHRLPGLSKPEIRTALNELREKHPITRRNPEADIED